MRFRIHLCITIYLLIFATNIGGQTLSLLTNEQKIAGLALLWKEADYNFVFFDRTNLDWNKSFQEFIPKVIATKSDIEYVRVLQRFLAQLQEGHTNVVPITTLWKRYAAQPPLELDVIENRPVVVNAGKSLVKDIPIGSVILTVDDIPVDDYLNEKIFPFISASTEKSRLYKAINGRGEPAIGLLVREVGETIKLIFETPEGKQQKIIFKCLAPNEKIDWVKPPESDEKIFNLKWLKGEIALIELNGFDKKEVLDGFEASLPELTKAKAIIFDIRKNQGGNSGYGDAIGSHFITKPSIPIKWRARENISVYRAWGRYKNYPQYKNYLEGKSFTNDKNVMVEPSSPFFDVPVVVLTGHKTYSAAENFAVLMSQMPQVKIIGSPTAGSTGQPIILKIENVAFAAITAKRDMLPDGTDFIGRGVLPQIEVSQTIKAFQDGRDLVLERAIELLR